MIKDEDKAIEQVLTMVQKGIVYTTKGEIVEVKADTVCIHGDSEKALAFANKIKSRLEEANIIVGSFK